MQIAFITFMHILGATVHYTLNVGDDPIVGELPIKHLIFDALFICCATTAVNGVVLATDIRLEQQNHRSPSLTLSDVQHESAAFFVNDSQREAPHVEVQLVNSHWNGLYSRAKVAPDLSPDSECSSCNNMQGDSCSLRSAGYALW